MMGRRGTRLVLWACAWAVGSALWGATVYVSPTGDDAAAGTEAAPKKTIQAVLNSWSRGTELVLLPGVYHLQENKVAGETGALHLNGEGTIRGATGNPEDVVIDGDATTECIRLAGKMTVRDMTFQNGKIADNKDASGANVSVQGAGVVVSNCLIRATAGGGRPAMGLTGLTAGAKILDCQFLCVTGTVEGAVLNLAESNRVENCRFVDCVVTNGAANAGPGAVRARRGVTLRNCTFTRMTGLALKATCLAESPTRIENCTFTENAGALGGVCWVEDHVVVDGCTFTSNACSASGGAVYAGGALLTNCVFRENTAAQFGGALVSVATEETPTRVLDSLFAGNEAASSGGAVSSGYRATAAASGNATNGFVRLEGCLISNNLAKAEVGNDAYFGGGGVFFIGKSHGDNMGGGTLLNCRIVDNRSGKVGGGVGVRNFAQGGGFTGSRPILIRNCLIARNTSAREGGGLYLIHNGADGPYVLDSCTVVSNQTALGAASGHGLYHKMAGVSCTNTLFALNTMVTDLQGNYSHCCFDPAQGTSGSGAQAMGGAAASVTADARLADPEHGDYRLASSRSPCCNAGLAEAWMADAADLDGNPRLFSSAPDIGCYELSWPLGTLILFR